MNEDTDGLHAVANTNDPDRIADVVFIHGLGGSSHSTWRHGSINTVGHFFWPEELAKDVQCGIWTLGYPAGITALGEPGMIIQLRAGNLSQKLANARIGGRPIIFVTHSMGGLIVKSLLVGSRTLGDQDRQKIAEAAKGVIFCATPHRGSDFANAAETLGSFFGGTQDHLIQLKSSAQELNILHDEFVEWQRLTQLKVCSYAENIGLFKQRPWLRPLPLGRVVTRDSANPNIGGHVVRDVDDDHLTIVKPRNRQHDVYAGTLRFIEEIVQDIKTRARGRVKSVLIADDHPLALESLEYLFIRKWPSIHVLTAKDGAEALQKINAEHPDLVMLDLKMPRLNGHQVLAELNKMRSNIPVFIYTGNLDPEVREWTFSAYENTVGYLHKSESSGEMAGKIKKYIDAAAANDSEV
jgi:CheY-like chemotaxis protein